jgi:hypothetical protein
VEGGVTCIVGIADGESVWLGGDSAGISGWDKTIFTEPKVFRNGEWVMGFTTSFRMGQLLQHVLVPPRLPEPSVPLERFMVTEFIDAVRQTLRGGGFAKKENDVERGGQFLVGIRGRLFFVDSDYQVGESTDGYAAIGSGFAYALGSLYATEGADNEDRVRASLKAAVKFSAGVAEPFNVVKA